MILVTGGCGFIGSNFIHLMRELEPERELVNFDALTYAGNLENLAALESDPGLRFEKGDISDVGRVREVFERYPIEAVVHFAAESHVDRSILEPDIFIRSNIAGTQILLDAARAKWGKGEGRFVMVSTDEVYGSLGPTGLFREDTPLDPSSPYSASKAGADLICQSYFRTFGFPVLITRCSNNYGPYQFPEKLIPLMIQRASGDETLPIYGDGLNVRDWIHVRDHCRAVREVLRGGEPGRVYNIGASSERSNIEIVNLILNMLGKGEELIEYVTDRPGHDRRYAMDSSRIESELGWRPEIEFERGIRDTIEWYQGNGAWMGRILSKEYQEYFERQYGAR